MKKIGKFIVFSLALLVCCGLAQAEDVKFNASVDKTTVALDELFNYTLTLSGVYINYAPTPPSFSNLIPVSQIQASNLSVVNGQARASIYYTYTLQPTKIGSASIGSASIAIGGNVYHSNPINIQVVKATGRSQRVHMPSSVLDEFNILSDPFFSSFRRSPVTDPIQVEINVSRTTAYVNQMVLLTFTFLQRVNLAQMPNYVPPDTTGFWTVNLPMRKKQREVTIKGVRYLAQDIKAALFPTTAGQLTIGPATLTAQIDPFSSPITLKTKPIVLHILPLPENGKPDDFSGAVGRYSLTALIDQQGIQRGKPFTLKAKIAGEGNLSSLPEPALELGEGLRKLSVTSQDNLIKSYAAVAGSKTFEYVIMPIKEGSSKIGPLRLSYFDPASGQYKTLVSQVFPLNVQSSNLPLPKEMEEELKPAGQGDLKVTVDWKRALKRIIRVFIQPLLLAVLAIVLLVWGVWYGVSKYQSVLQADPAGYRRRIALGVAKKRLKKSRALLNAKKEKDFIADIFESVVHYLGDKFSFSSMGITTDQLKAVLAQKGVGDDLQKRVEDFVLECDLLRFTPALLDRKKAEELFLTAQKLIVEMEEGSAPSK